MALHTNSSNNTLYADADGNIAYFHSNFVPRRDTSFDWRQPGGRQQSRRPSGKALHTFDESAERGQSAERVGLQHEQLPVLRGGPATARSRSASRATWTPAARIRAACTRSWC